MEKPSDQKPTIAHLAMCATKKVEALNPANCHALISCSKSKGDHRDLARNMYISPLYRKSVAVAEAWGLSFSILSAKYGLLDPDETIEPYDVTLKGASKQSKVQWAQKVDGQIRSSIDRGKQLILLAGEDYYAPLIQVGKSSPLNFVAPMRGIALGNRLVFLNQCIRIRQRRKAIARSYAMFAQLVDSMGLHKLRDIFSKELPKQGVYFFFDDGEPTVFSISIPRLVRIGTHGVSAGSVATLRNRLRTHLGTRAGGGNHRASVFRLHVGRAIIERERLHDVYPNWGKGQSAPKEITEVEAPLEHMVSEYIGKVHTPALSSHINGHSTLNIRPLHRLIAFSTALMDASWQSGYPEYSVSLAPQTRVRMSRRNATLAHIDSMIKLRPGIYRSPSANPSPTT